MRRAFQFALLFLLAAVPASATITYTTPTINTTGSCASANANNCTPTATTVGQLAVYVGFRSGSTTAPTCPTNWTCPAAWTGSGGSSSTAISWRAGCFVWTATNGSVTSTNAGNVTLLSIAGSDVANRATCNLVVGGFSSTTAASTTLSYGTITFTGTTGQSIILEFGGSRTATNVATGASVTQRVTSGTTMMAVGGESGGTKAFAGETVTANTNTRNVGIVLEILPLYTCANQICHVQTVNKNESSSRVTSTTLVLPTSVTASSLITVFGNMYDNVTVTCTDDLKNTYQATIYPTRGVGFHWFCYAMNANAGATTVTLTLSGAGSYVTAIASEWTGVATTSALETNLGKDVSPACTDCTGAAVTTTTAGVVIQYNSNITAGNTFTAGTGYTIPTNGQVSGGNQCAMLQYQTTTKGGTYEPHFTATSDVFSSETAGFMEPAAAPGGCVPSLTLLGVGGCG